MIFVIIGVIILVVSFIIALQSLVKEQNKFQSLPDREKHSGIKEAEGRDKQQHFEPKKNDGPVTIQPLVQDEDKRSASGREPFPWDKEFGAENIKKPESEEEKIERLKSQLEQIKATKGLTILPKQEEGQKEEIHETNSGLSGEISLSDLKKKAA